MGDGENSCRGAEWEFVSLTASAYAAAPGPKGFDAQRVEENEDIYSSNQEDVLDAMFMSKHFMFPPCDQQKNVSEFSEIHGESQVKTTEEPNKFEEEDWKVKPDDDLHGLMFFDKGKSLSDQGLEFGEGKELDDLAVVCKEEVLYGDARLSDVHHHYVLGESAKTCEVNNSCHETAVPRSDYMNALKKKEASMRYDGSHAACEAWWKRQAVSMYNHAKGGNTLWSVFVAAAVMGLALLGQRWQREKLQLQQLKWHFEINEENFSRMLVPFTRFKDILVGGHQRNLLIRGGPTSNQQ